VPVSDFLWIRNVKITAGETLSVYDGIGNCIDVLNETSSQNGLINRMSNSTKLIGQSANGLDLGLDVSALKPGVYYLKMGVATARFLVSR
jgi:hypothetical protein